MFFICWLLMTSNIFRCSHFFFPTPWGNFFHNLNFFHWVKGNTFKEENCQNVFVSPLSKGPCWKTGWLSKNKSFPFHKISLRVSWKGKQKESPKSCLPCKNWIPQEHPYYSILQTKHTFLLDIGLKEFVLYLGVTFIFFNLKDHIHFSSLFLSL